MSFTALKDAEEEKIKINYINQFFRSCKRF